MSIHLAMYCTSYRMVLRPKGADTPPPTGQLDGSPRAATALSRGWLKCVFNGCRHTSQDGQLHRPPRRPDHSMSHSAAWHTQTGCPVQLAPSVVVCPQPKGTSHNYLDLDPRAHLLMDPGTSNPLRGLERFGPL